MVGLILNDQLFATIIGVLFTAGLGLLAWIVRTLARVAEKVDGIDKRVERLEDVNDSRPWSPKPSPATP